MFVLVEVWSALLIFFYFFLTIIILQGKRGKFNFYALPGPSAFQTCGLWALAVCHSLLRMPGKVTKKCKVVANKLKLWVSFSSRNILKDLHLEKMLKTFSVSQICNALCINFMLFPLTSKEGRRSREVWMQDLKCWQLRYSRKRDSFGGYFQYLAEAIDVLVSVKNHSQAELDDVGVCHEETRS